MYTKKEIEIHLIKAENVDRSLVFKDNHLHAQLAIAKMMFNNQFKRK